MSEGDLLAVWLTLKLAASTTAILLLLSPPLAWWLSRSQHRLRPLVEALVALPLVLIIGLMAVRGELVPARGALRELHYPRSPRPRAVGRNALVLSGAFERFNSGEVRDILKRPAAAPAPAGSNQRSERESW